MGKQMKEVTTFDWEVLNGNSAIWTRSKDDISDEEYQSFYGVLTKGEGKAEIWTHFNAEGNINFRSILYVPKDVPQGWQFQTSESQATGLSLYVRKVLISDTFELLPRYLYFMKGVVDSDDLPLNVNRETLQESKIIKIIKKKVVRKAIEMIRKMSQKPMPEDEEAEEAEVDADGNVVVKEDEDEDKPDKVHPYIEWYKKFGLSLKMGCIDDSANKDKLQKLLRFKSSKTEGENDYVSLQEYIERMPEWQKEIYVFPGETIKTLKESSFMDAFIE